MFALMLIPAAIFAALSMFLQRIAAWFGWGPEAAP